MHDTGIIAELRTLVEPMFDGLILNALACGSYANAPCYNFP